MFARTIVILSLVAIIAGCGEEETNAEATQTDKVSITAISIGSPTKTGQQDYVVEVSYELQSQPQGEILIGFGQSGDEFRINLNQTVPQGTGVLTFNVAGPLIGGAIGNPVPAYANLSPYPHETTWKALASHKVEVSPDGTIREMPEAEG